MRTDGAGSHAAGDPTNRAGPHEPRGAMRTDSAQTMRTALRHADSAAGNRE